MTDSEEEYSAEPFEEAGDSELVRGDIETTAPSADEAADEFDDEDIEDNDIEGDNGLEGGECPAFILYNRRAYSVPMSDGSTAGRVRDHRVAITVPDGEALWRLNNARSWPPPSEVPPLAIVVVKGSLGPLRLSAQPNRGPFVWYCRFSIATSPNGPDGNILRHMPGYYYQQYVRSLAMQPNMRGSSLLTNYVSLTENRLVLNVFSNAFPLAAQPVRSEATPPPRRRPAPPLPPAAEEQPAVAEEQPAGEEGNPSPVKRLRTVVADSAEHLICPITHELPSDPVFAGDGIVYERRAIATWLRTNSTSPKTNLPISNVLFAAPQVKSTIEALVVGGALPSGVASSWALRNARLLAEAGDAASACTLARWYETGAMGLEQSDALAVDAVQKFADDSADAAGVLARLMLKVGPGIQSSVYVYSGAAAALGNTEGKFVLAILLSGGDSGMPPNLPRALKLAEQVRAADRLNSAGLLKLALWYAQGVAGPVDRDKAKEALRAAVVKGRPSEFAFKAGTILGAATDPNRLVFPPMEFPRRGLDWDSEA